MGMLRKWLGVDKQIAAQDANARRQEEAIKESANAQQLALNASAKAAADQQAIMAEREAATAKAAAAAQQPLALADVQLAAPEAAATRRERRGSFGRGAASMKI